MMEPQQQQKALQHYVDINEAPEITTTTASDYDENQDYT